MSKADLKAAMESLQVRKPLRLPARQPQFVAPTPVAEPTEVAQATQVPTATQVEGPTQVAPATQVVEATPVPTPTQVAPQTPVPASTQVETPTPAPGATEVSRETRVSVPTPVDGPTQVVPTTQVVGEAPVATPTPVAPATQVAPQTQARVDEGTLPTASDQDSSVTLEAHAAPKLHNGYTRLPNNVLMRMAAGELVRSEIQVLLLIARFTISFQRRHAPLSKTVLERQSGLRGPAVLQAISELLAKGLIEKIPGDQHRPNQLGLVFTEEWDFFSKGAGNGKTSVAPATQVAPQTTVPSETPVATQPPVPTANSASVAAATPAGGPGATDFKDTPTRKNNSSLLQLPNALREYFADLKPARKRESEWQALEGLLEDYSADDIADSLSLLQARGIVRRGPNGEESQPCHSPMAYLSKAMGEVLPEALERRRKADERAERGRREAEVERLRQEAESREAAMWAAKEQAFAKAFPTQEQQREALDELLRGLPFSPDSHPGRIMGIGRWYENNARAPGCGHEG